MLPVELEGLRGSMVEALRIRQKVGEGGDLSDNWPILYDFTHHILRLVRDAVVLQSVELVLHTANVGLEVICFALGLGSLALHALLWDKTSLAAPVENLVDVATVASKRVGIAVNDLLG
jgi:hypothetical protein